MVDPWEALQPTYTTTAKVLDHFDEEINKALGGGIDVECETNGDADDHSHEENGVEEEGEGGNGVAAANHEASSADSAAATTDGTVGHKKKRRKKKRVRVALLAGADLIETMVRTLSFYMPLLPLSTRPATANSHGQR